jgi:DNA helicase-2/ATP-dependent DNA helicase PcrA
MDYLSDLNPEQRAAAAHYTGPLLVLAGAGSGKTRVLIHRIAHLMSYHGVDPRSILAVTFTNKAAQEMRDRVARLLGVAGVDVFVSTFHSLCVRLLRLEHMYINRTSSFAIFDTTDQVTAVKQCLRELEIDDRSMSPSAVLGAISNAKNQLMDADAYAKQASDFWQRQVAKVYIQYQAKLAANNAFDFDDLIFECVKLLRSRSDVLDKYQERFRFIMVDEYQDTNHAQYVLVNLLAQKYRNICVVGDDDQSIYHWRGADIRNILEFERDYPDAKVIKLERNYRSTRSILECANAVVSRNVNRKPKRLWTDKGSGHSICWYRAYDERDEARFTVSTIEDLIVSEHRSYKDFAVLYRTNAQSRTLEEELLNRGVPYQIVGGLRFYQRKEIKDILAYLRVIDNPRDSVSLMRIINTPRRGIGAVTLDRLSEYARMKGVSIYDALTDESVRAMLGSRTQAALESFCDLLSDLIALAGSSSPSEIVKAVLEKTRYIQELVAEEQDSVEAESKAQNLQELISVTRNFEKGQESSSLSDFLQEVALLSDIDTLQDDKSGVTLMTMHSAKGLEFPVVFLVGMDEGVFPFARSMFESSEIEEERRLCYVGITRAMDRLFLVSADSRMLFGTSSTNPPSRFIEEMPREFVEEVGTGSSEAVSAVTASGRGSSIGSSSSSSRARSDTTRATDAQRCEWSTGAKVRHAQFGIGTIVSVSESGSDRILTVAFPDKGVKRLMESYASLEPVR